MVSLVLEDDVRLHGLRGASRDACDEGALPAVGRGEAAATGMAR